MKSILRTVLIAVFLATIAAGELLAIPAFARKYGVRCTACHEAWPVLNNFGRAFRDNGYQLLLGKDDPVTTNPAYIPVSIRITPHYEFNEITNQPTDQGTKKLRSGGFGKVEIDLLTGGTLFKDVSFLVVPTGFSDGVTLEAAWVRFDNLLKSSWLNLKIGKHEVDLPRSSHRPWSLASTGYLIYGFHSPGSISAYDMGENQRGIEYFGHDRGSLNRVAFSVFNVENSPGSRNVFDTPGFYFHATHQWLFDSSAVSSAKIGVFGSYANWPTTTLTSDGVPIPGQGGNLQASTKYGAEGHIWFGPEATPLHAVLVFAHGRDSKELIPEATRSGTFNGGYLELGFTPSLKTTIFGRVDIVRNSQQGVEESPKSFGDHDAISVGLRHTFNFTNRAEYALHVEYTTLRTKKTGVDGLDVRSNTYFVGIDFGY
ncbi:MAG: hypothetical protein M3R62_08690 [Acidobacteriota bacterium]|nr:hypothetical protein [Acidobacteriota bacterium]